MVNIFPAFILFVIQECGIYFQEIDENIDEHEHTEYVKDAADNENIWEEVLKPEYESGRRFVEWLGRKLPYLEVYTVLLEINFTISFKKIWQIHVYSKSVLVKHRFTSTIAPRDAIHCYFNREWSWKKFELKLNVLVVSGLESLVYQSTLY